MANIITSYGTPQHVAVYPTEDVPETTGTPPLSGYQTVAGDYVFLGSGQTTTPATLQGLWQIPTGGGAWTAIKLLANFTVGQLPLYIMADNGTGNKNILWMIGKDVAGTGFVYTNATSGGEVSTIVGTATSFAILEPSTGVLTSNATMVTSNLEANSVSTFTVALNATANYQIKTQYGVAQVNVTPVVPGVELEVVAPTTYTLNGSGFITEALVTVKNNSATTDTTVNLNVVIQGLAV